MIMPRDLLFWLVVILAPCSGYVGAEEDMTIPEIERYTFSGEFNYKDRVQAVTMTIRRPKSSEMASASDSGDRKFRAYYRARFSGKLSRYNGPLTLHADGIARGYGGGPAMKVSKKHFVGWWEGRGMDISLDVRFGNNVRTVEDVVDDKRFVRLTPAPRAQRGSPRLLVTGKISDIQARFGLIELEAVTRLDKSGRPERGTENEGGLTVALDALTPCTVNGIAWSVNGLEVGMHVIAEGVESDEGLLAGKVGIKIAESEEIGKVRGTVTHVDGSKALVAVQSAKKSQSQTTERTIETGVSQIKLLKKSTKEDRDVSSVLKVGMSIEAYLIACDGRDISVWIKEIR